MSNNSSILVLTKELKSSTLSFAYAFLGIGSPKIVVNEPGFILQSVTFFALYAPIKATGIIVTPVFFAT